MRDSRGEPKSEIVDWIAKQSIGSVHLGTVTKHLGYGFLVQVGPAIGLCHKSQMSVVGRQVDHLVVGISYEFEVLTTDPTRARISLRLARKDRTSRGRREERRHSAHSAAWTTGAVVADAAGYASTITDMVRNGATSINSVGCQYRNLDAPKRTGFVAEADHVATFNTDAAFKRSGVEATRLASHEKFSPDIAIHGKDGQPLGAVSSKVYRDGPSAAKAQRGYGKQARLVPTDQLDDVRAVARSRASAERAKGRPNREAVAAEFNEVADLATDRVKNGQTESTPRTRAESKKTAEKARQGEVSGADIVGDYGPRIKDGAKQGAKGGAIAGAAASGVISVAVAVGRVSRGETTISDAAVQVGVETVKGSIEGAIKGAASGAATAAAQVAIQRVGSGALKTLLRGNAPAAVAVVGVDVAKQAIRLATGTIDVAEFKSAAGEAVGSGAASYIGSAIGGAIGGPAGVLIGGVAGSMLASKASEEGLLARLERSFGPTTTGVDGAEAHHLEQIAAVARALRASRAAVVFDRLVPTSDGHHLAVAAVIVVGDSVIAIDVRGWRGSLAFAPVIKSRRVHKSFMGLIDIESQEDYDTGEVDERTIVQTKISGGGSEFTKRHPNPLRRVNAASREIKHWLSRRNSSWKGVWIEPMVVFAGDGVVLEGPLGRASNMVQLSTLQAKLSTACAPAPSWILEDLLTMPTWDVLVDREGRTYQGIIKEMSFQLLVEGGNVVVPYLSILKVDIAAGGFLSRADEVVVTLRSGVSVRGLVEKSPVTLERMGHSRSFLIKDLMQVCPASTFFAEART